MKKIKYCYVCLVLLCLPIFGYSQLYIDAEGNAGLGIETSPDARMKILNSDELTTLFLENNKVDNGTKYGIDNFVYNQGTGVKYGVRSSVFQNASTSSDVFGHAIDVTPNGSGKAYGLFYQVRDGGTGVKYGVRSSVTQGSNNILYNYFADSYPNGDGTAYGLYTNLHGSGKGARYGVFNASSNPAGTAQQLYGIFSSTSNAGSQPSFGIYNYAYSNNCTGDVYALYSLMYGTTTGTKYGFYSFVPSGEGYAGYFVGDVAIFGNFNNASDENLKENINRIDNALSIINQLEPKSYNYRQSGNNVAFSERKQYGFLAQEVEAILPDIVSNVEYPKRVVPRDQNINTSETTNMIEEGEDEIFKSMDYNSIIALLTQGIKEQQVIIQQLEQRIVELENK